MRTSCRSRCRRPPLRGRRLVWRRRGWRAPATRDADERVTTRMGEKDHSDRAVQGAGGLLYVPLETIRRVRHEVTDPVVRAQLMADICRANTLYMIMNAGSGH